MQQHINCFCALSPLTVKMAVAVCAAVDVADIFAIAGVVVCALRTPFSIPNSMPVRQDVKFVFFQR